MRQLILAEKYKASGEVAEANAKDVGFVYNNSADYDKPTYGVAANCKDYFNIVFKKDATNDIVYPAYKKNFTYSVAKFAAMTSNGTVTVTLADFETYLTPGRDVTVVVVKKGIKFNERNKWSYVHRVTDTDTTSTITKAIADYFNANPECGVRASNSGDRITFTTLALDGAATIMFTDDFSRIHETGSADYKTKFEIGPKYVDDSDATLNLVPSIKAYLEDLLSKAAADAGYRDTRQDNKLYPGLTGTSGIDVTPYADGFTVFTLRFQEPRIVKQALNEDVTQVIQIVLPTTDASAAATLATNLADFGTQID